MTHKLQVDWGGDEGVARDMGFERAALGRYGVYDLGRG
jgi:hypothetical protein